MYQFTKRLQLLGDDRLHMLGSMAYKIRRACKCLWFSVFPNFRKVGKFAAFIECPNSSVSASEGGGFAHLTL